MSLHSLLAACLNDARLCRLQYAATHDRRDLNDAVKSLRDARRARYHAAGSVYRTGAHRFYASGLGQWK